jgi:hypothetical protein
MDFQNAAIKLNMIKAKYKDFSNAAGLPYQLERAIPRPGFTRSIASKAV